MEASERQVKLAQKLSEFRQRSQLKATQQLISELGLPSDCCTIHLPNTSASKQLEQWLSTSFPWQCGQIDWQQVAGSICVKGNSHPEEASAFDRICQTQQLGNPLVNVMWFSAHRSTLEIPLEFVKRSLVEIVAEDWDTWIFEPISGWCIEFYHEGTMCYGVSR